MQKNVQICVEEVLKVCNLAKDKASKKPMCTTKQTAQHESRGKYVKTYVNLTSAVTQKVTKVNRKDVKIINC